MPYQQKPGDISVFAETAKSNPKAPDWKGSMVHPDTGEVLEVALWAKGDRGTMLAGTVKPPPGRPGVTDEEIDRDFDGTASSRRIQERTDRFGPKPADPSDEIPF